MWTWRSWELVKILYKKQLNFISLFFPFSAKKVLTKAVTDTINELNWRDMVILYDSSDAFVRLHTVFQGIGLNNMQMKKEEGIGLNNMQMILKR